MFGGKRTSSLLPTTNRTHRKHMNSRDFKSSKDTKFKWRNKKYIRNFIVKLVLAVITIALIVFFYNFELHVELAKYNRGWVRTEIKETRPLAGCFDKISKDYDIKSLNSPKYNVVQGGLSYKHGFDCYGHSKLIQMQEGQGKVKTTIHLYWRSDIAPLGYREKVLLDSIFATQDLDFVEIKLWSNGDLFKYNNDFLNEYTNNFPHHFSVEQFDLHELSVGTPLEHSKRLDLKDTKAWLDGDIIRILLLWAYGGIWIDMDSIVIRDLQPLLEHEFVTQWDCYG